MTTVYKLTDQDMRTYNGCQWELNRGRSASGEGELCGPGFLHAYTSPLLAVMLNPSQANINNPRLFRADGVIAKTDKGLKIGCTKLTLLEELPLSVITTRQRVRFAILCSKQVYKKHSWNDWADNWLSGKDRTWAARAAEEAVRNPLNLIALAETAIEEK